jgi:hypothetical protein
MDSTPNAALDTRWILTMDSRQCAKGFSPKVVNFFLIQLLMV